MVIHHIYIYIYTYIYISFISYRVSEKWGQKPSFPTVWNCSFRSNKKKNTMLGPLTGSRWVAKENQRTVPAATRPFSGTPSCNRRWTMMNCWVVITTVDELVNPTHDSKLSELKYLRRLKSDSRDVCSQLVWLSNGCISPQILIIWVLKNDQPLFSQWEVNHCFKLFGGKITTFAEL